MTDADRIEVLEAQVKALRAHCEQLKVIARRDTDYAWKQTATIKGLEASLLAQGKRHAIHAARRYALLAVGKIRGKS